MDPKAVVAVLVSGLGLAGCVTTTSYTDAPPQVVEQTGAFGVMQQGNLDGVEYLLETNIFPYSSGGMLALCAISKLAADTDISPRFVESMHFPQSTITVTAGSAKPVEVSTRFIPVRYVKTKVTPKKAEIEEIKTLVMSRGVPGGCVVTNRAWDDAFAPENKSAGRTVRLKLKARDPRTRSQTVVEGDKR